MHLGTYSHVGGKFEHLYMVGLLLDKVVYTSYYVTWFDE
jgi:hypothetical protein